MSGISVCTTVAWWLIPVIPVSGIYFSVYYLGIVADLWDSCIWNLCLNYCDVVTNLLDSSVRNFCVFYSSEVADPRDSCALDFCVYCVYNKDALRFSHYL